MLKDLNAFKDGSATVVAEDLTGGYKIFTKKFKRRASEEFTSDSNP